MWIERFNYPLKQLRRYLRWELGISIAHLIRTQPTLKLRRVKDIVTNVIDIVCIIDTQIFLMNYLLFAELKSTKYLYTDTNFTKDSLTYSTKVTQMY